MQAIDLVVTIDALWAGPRTAFFDKLTFELDLALNENRPSQRPGVRAFQRDIARAMRQLCDRYPRRGLSLNVNARLGDEQKPIDWAYFQIQRSGRGLCFLAEGRRDRCSTKSAAALKASRYLAQAFDRWLQLFVSNRGDLERYRLLTLQAREALAESRAEMRRSALPPISRN